MIDKKNLLETVMDKAGKKYRELKMAKNPYQPPEAFPDTLPSDQIRALAAALVDEIVDLIESSK
jgi:hypothetical protein